MKSRVKSMEMESELDMFEVYNPNAPDNIAFQKAKEKIINYFGTRYTHIKCIIEDNKTPDLDKPVLLPFNDNNNNIQQTIYLESMKLYLRKEQEYIRNQELAYSVLWKQCSHALQNTISQETNFNEMRSKFKLLELWKIVERVCTSGPTIKYNQKKRQWDAMKRFINLCQNPNEDIGDFYIRFNEEYKALKGAGGYILHPQCSMEQIEQEKYIDESLAMIFLECIDSAKYDNVLTYLKNSVATSRDAYPKTLTESYQLVMSYGSQVNNVAVKSQVAFNVNTNHNGNPNPSRPTRPLITCEFCGKRGHDESKCWNKKKNSDNNTSTVAMVQHTAFGIIAKAITNGHTMDNECVLLDSGASTGIFNNKSLLTDIRHESQGIIIEGVGGNVQTNVTGEFAPFGRVYFHERSIANLLSFSDVRKLGRVVFETDPDRFIVRIGEQEFKFENINKLFVWKPKSETVSIVKTVETMMSQFTKREIEQATEARKLIANYGYPSTQDLSNAISNGDIINTSVTATDFKNAEIMWGKDLATLKGKTVRTRPNVVVNNSVLKHDVTDVTLSIDLFYISGVLFLMSISDRLKLVIVTNVQNKSAKELHTALKTHIEIYGTRNYRVTAILTDGEAGIVADMFSHQGVRFNVTAKNEHVGDIERMGRTLKERVRCHWNILPYKMDKEMIVHCVCFCVSAINMFPKDNSIGHKAPRELFLGCKSNCKTDARLAFGEYVQVDEDDMKTNGMESRTSGAISLGPNGNMQGGYNFLSLATNRVLSRKSWTIMPMPNEVINLMNARATKNGVKEEVTTDDDLKVHHSTMEQAIEPEIEIRDDSVVEHSIDTIEANSHDEMEDTAQTMENETHNAEIVIPTDEVTEQPSRYNLRSTRSNWRDRYTTAIAHFSALANMSVGKSLKTMGGDAKTAIMSELRQIHDKGVFEAVRYSDLTPKQKMKIIRSLMFVKRKRNGTVKARLVANGKQQIRSKHDDLSSPTVSTEALFITAVIDAHEKRYVATADIEGAFLHADMTSTVIIELDQQLTSILVELYPEVYLEYVNKAGKLLLRLKKALYGTIEAAKLFYYNLKNSLSEINMIPNEYDECVFNGTINGSNVTITVHVDDLKISSTCKESVEKVLEHLRFKYKKISVNEGPVVEYLGMIFDYSTEGEVAISMKQMIDEAINEMNVSGTSACPANLNLFNVNEDSPPMSKDNSDKFHSSVAKLLYVAKRGRPDILTAVSFLTTRVTCSTEEDSKKLEKVLKYLNGSRDLILRLKGNDNMVITTYIDASYASHVDGKGHTGAMVTLGGGAVRSKSSKQKLVAKSSTESELIGMSDEIGQAIWTRNFLIAQGFKVPPIQLKQDNMSTITIVNKGKPNSGRTKHIAIRYFFIKDKIDSKEVELEHLSTNSMVADILTKPLQGELFRRHRKVLLNHN
jgi:hypothetical protein